MQGASLDFLLVFFEFFFCCLLQVELSRYRGTLAPLPQREHCFHQREIRVIDQEPDIGSDFCALNIS